MCSFFIASEFQNSSIINKLVSIWPTMVNHWPFSEHLKSVTMMPTIPSFLLLNVERGLIDYVHLSQNHHQGSMFYFKWKHPLNGFSLNTLTHTQQLEIVLQMTYPCAFNTHWLTMSAH